MPTIDTSSSAAAKFQNIASKRQALESLIEIAAGIHHQQSALNDLALAAKPSQIFSAKVIAFFDQIEQRMQTVSVSEVLQKLEAVESITQKTFNHIIKLTSLDVNQLRDNQIEDIDVARFSDAIINFKRRTQTALAFRILLQKRGVAIHPFKLPVSQESISEQIEKLKQKESQCVQQVKQEINDIISETNALLNSEALPDSMKNELVSVKQAMRANLSHLDDGGLITEIPHSFEVITLETNEPDYLNLESNSSKPASSTDDDNTDRQPVAEKPDQVPQVENPSPIETKIKDRKLSRDDNQLSFWGLLKAWLLSPWSTSWQNIKEKHNKKP